MSLTDTQYANFIDRLIACREAEDSAKEATKQVYAELADAGEDKTIAGLVVRQQRMTAKDRAKADMRDAAAEDGQSRYLRGKASHVRAREGRKSDHDPETGEVTETPLADIRAEGRGLDTVDPLHESDAAMRPQTEATVGSFASNAGVGAVAYPATSSTAARMDALGTEGTEPTPAELEATNPPAGEQAEPVAGTQAPPVDTISNPVTAPHVPRVEVTVDAGRESASDPSALPVVRHPGEQWTERCPAEPVRRNDYARCFPDYWGMPLAELKDSIREEGVREPIVKRGTEILDGWARYTIARELGIDYPVREYDGTDPLLDIIRWNLDARQLGANERKLIATKLAKLSPDRGEEIADAFGLAHERAAAE